MLLRLALLTLCLLLASCKLNLPGADETLLTGPLQFGQVEFQRSGGKQCPGAPGITEENAQCATLKVSYPKVTSSTVPATADALNRFMMAQILEYSDDNGKAPTSLEELAQMFIQEYQDGPTSESSWELERTIAATFSNDALLTLRYGENGYTGGAHPFSGQTYFIFDVHNGKPLTLKNLLVPGFEDALNVAGEKAMREARDIPTNISLEDAGFTFAQNVFKVNGNVGVSPEGLVFQFNPYEVAPYAMGPIEFTIPYGDIRDLIPKDSPLSVLIK
jgi:hypothetical protein